MSIDTAPVAQVAPAKSRRRWLIGAVLAAALLWPTQYALWKYHLKRYQAVDEGILYRTGQPTEWGLRYLVSCKGVKTVLSLQMDQMRLCRGPYDPFEPSGAEESEFVTGLGSRGTCNGPWERSGAGLGSRPGSSTSFSNCSTIRPTCPWPCIAWEGDIARGLSRRCPFGI